MGGVKLGRHTAIFAVGMLLVCITSSVSEASLAATTTGSVVGAYPDFLEWNKIINGGAEVSYGANLTMTTTADYNCSWAEVVNPYKFTGDFDVQVDYRAGSGWDDPLSYHSSINWVACMVVAIDKSHWVQVSQMVHPGGQTYAVWSPMDEVPATFDACQPRAYSGRLRIVRSDSGLTFYVYADGGWRVRSLASFSGCADPASISLRVYSDCSYNSFSTVFGNFTINYGETGYVPPPPLVWKNTFPNRTDFFVGGAESSCLYNQLWGGMSWDLDPWKSLKENGGEWAQIRVSNVHTKALSETPAELWGTLKQPDEYWSIEYCGELMRRAQESGLRLDLVFWLSDTWSGWGPQEAPAEWKGLSVEETSVKLENFTYTTAEYYESQGLNIEIYEIGNEIQEGILNFKIGDRIPPPESGVDILDYMEDTVWKIEAQLLKHAISGVRRADPDAKIVLHAAGLGYGPSYEETENRFFRTMVEEGVDFDYAGLTHPYMGPTFDDPNGWAFFPYSNRTWFQHMNNEINAIAAYGKKVIICEAVYPHSSHGFLCDPMPGYPFTPEGQAAWLHDQLLFASNNENIVGWFYWSFGFFPGEYDGLNWAESTGLFASPTQAQPALREFLMGRTPASFEISRLTIEPVRVEVNRNASVSVNVRNTGGISGVYNIELKLNGTTVESKRVLLNSNTQKTVSFKVTKATAGIYRVEVENLSAVFSILRPASINVRSLQVSKSLVRAGEEVTVNATLENTGEVDGSYALEFNLDGIEMDFSTVAVKGNSVAITGFRFSSAAEGMHTVTAGGKSVVFEVEKASTSRVPAYQCEVVLMGLSLAMFALIVSRKHKLSSVQT